MLKLRMGDRLKCVLSDFRKATVGSIVVFNPCAQDCAFFGLKFVSQRSRLLFRLTESRPESPHAEGMIGKASALAPVSAINDGAAAPPALPSMASSTGKPLAVKRKLDDATILVSGKKLRKEKDRKHHKEKERSPLKSHGQSSAVSKKVLVLYLVGKVFGRRFIFYVA